MRQVSQHTQRKHFNKHLQNTTLPSRRHSEARDATAQQLTGAQYKPRISQVSPHLAPREGMSAVGHSSNKAITCVIG